jgi:hypothetical protein
MLDSAPSQIFKYHYIIIAFAGELAEGLEFRIYRIRCTSLANGSNQLPDAVRNRALARFFVFSLSGHCQETKDICKHWIVLEITDLKANTIPFSIARGSYWRYSFGHWMEIT